MHWYRISMSTQNSHSLDLRSQFKWSYRIWYRDLGITSTKTAWPYVLSTDQLNKNKGKIVRNGTWPCSNFYPALSWIVSSPWNQGLMRSADKDIKREAFRQKTRDKMQPLTVTIPEHSIKAEPIRRVSVSESEINSPSSLSKPEHPVSNQASAFSTILLYRIW